MTLDAAHELAAAVLADGREVTVRLAGRADAPALLELVHAAFRARPVIGETAEALRDDLGSIVARLEHGHGYVAELDGRLIGVVMVARAPAGLRLGRVGVHPDHRRFGVASFLVGVVLEHLARAGHERVHLLVRTEFPQIQAWWARHGFERIGTEGTCHIMARALPVAVEVPDAEAMRALGRRLAGVLHAGDLIIATGDLGAGKTTLAQGIGAGLRVQGPVISPTFVLSRVHPASGDGPGLVHVDAYRLGSPDELADIDLDASLDSSVTLVEWGAGLAEGLAADRLEIDIQRSADPGQEVRWVFLTPVGARWDRAELAVAVKEPR